MRINSIEGMKYNNRNYYVFNNCNLNTCNDSFYNQSKFIAGDNYLYYKKGNVIRLVSFGKKSKPENDGEQISSLKMKVAAVSNFQDNISEITQRDVKNHSRINFELEEGKRDIKLFSDRTGKQIGCIHYEIIDYLYDEIKKNPQDFKIELASVMRFSGMNNAGLKVRMNYIGKEKDKFKKIFEEITEDPQCIDITYPYKKPESPEDILNLILKNKEKLYGSQAKDETELIINEIANVINNDANKSFLLVGHRTPDGDDIGSLLGMENAIELTGKGKYVDCSIDDQIPVLFKYLRDIKKIKIPEKKDLIKSFEQVIQIKREAGQDEEAQILENIKSNFSKNVKGLPKNKFYDVVIFMDVSELDRAGYKYAKYIGPQTKVIIIDHHPEKFLEWKNKKSLANFDIDEIKKNHLFWVENRVPAATEMVAVIAGKINPRLNSESSTYSRKEKNILKRLAAAILTGLQTDTSSYSRSANLFTEDMLLPRWERPMYNPIGVAKWFSIITDRKITKNFIEASLDNQEYKTKVIKKLIRETLPNYASRDDSIQLNHLQIDKSYIDKLWMEAAKETPDITLKDILGKIKYSSTFKNLKRITASQNGAPGIEDDTILYLMSQSSKKGDLNIDGKIPDSDTLSFSFRSKNGTNHAAILASLFDGGGHGAAAGGRISGQGLDFNSKLLVSINGVIENSTEKILQTLNDNFELEHSANACDGNDLHKSHIKIIQSPSAQEGRTANELIAEVVKEIRKIQLPKAIKVA